MSCARANLRLALLLLAVASCRGSADRVFELTAAGPSLTGLLDTPLCLVTLSDTGAVTCLSSKGEAVWRGEVCRPVRARPVVIGGTLWVACDSGEWSALDVKTGRPRWKQTGRRVPAGPLATDGLIGFVASADGTLEAIDETGLTLWTTPLAGTRLWAGGTIVAAAADGGVTVLDSKTGEKKWADEKPAVALSGDDALVICARSSGDLAAHDANTGELRWGTTLGAFAPDSLGVEGDAVTVGLGRGDVVTLDARTGSERSRAVLSAPLAAPVRHGVAVLQGREGCAVSLQGGQTACVDHQLRGSAVVRDGVLLLGPRDGRVLGFKLKPGAAP